MKSVSDLFRLDGRVALVTGGAGHIALACEEALAEAGANIVVADLNADACDQRAKQLGEAHGCRTLPLAMNLASADACRTLVEQTVSRFGRLDILVNNAAYTGASGVPGYAVKFPQQTVEAWDGALDVNLRAAFVLSQAAFPALSQNRSGAIINVASIYGVVGPRMSLYDGTEMGNPAAYAASKGGLIQLTRYLSTVMAPRVRVNCLSPGGVERGQPAQFRERYVANTPMQRMATEEDFKGAFAYLASDAAAYVTGQNLTVDGGWTAW